jgi:Na+/H+-dicarboxylate symporter
MGLISKIGVPQGSVSELLPMFSFNFPRIISNDTALLAGLLAGFASIFLKKGKIEKISTVLEIITKYFFRVLIPIMPLFIIGTAIKLQYDGVLKIILTKYIAVFGMFIIAAYGVLFIQYLLLSGFSMSRFVKSIKNVLPGVITGFGSMSSAAALPLSIKAAEDNVLYSKDTARMIVPATVNIHLVGDCFFIPMVALTIIFSFGMGTPSLYSYSIFAVYFVLAKFAVAAVPGGGILVMLPILQTYLGFNSDMLGLITAVYILFDPVITACNIFGNGALAMMFDRIVARLWKKAY